MIPQETLDAIRERISIAEIVEARVGKLKNGKALCPFHNEKSPSFQVNPQRNTFHCFGCQEGGDAIAFLKLYEGVPFRTAVEMAGAACGVSVEDADESEADKGLRTKKAQLYELHEKTAAWYFENQSEGLQGQHCRDYLAERQLSVETCAEWQIGHALADREGLHRHAHENGWDIALLIEGGLLCEKNGRVFDRWTDRIMIPIRDERGRCVAFSGRHIPGHEDRLGKYVNSPETPIFKKSKLLFGLHKAARAIGQLDFALVCEGQFDVIACRENGYGNAVAPQGTALTEDQVRILKRLTNSVTTAFDGDKAGIAATAKSFKLLCAAKLKVKVANLDGLDPDSFAREHGREAFTNAISRECFEYCRFHHAVLWDQSRDMAKDERRQFVTDAIIEDLQTLGDPMAWEDWPAILAQDFGVTPESVKAYMDQARGVDPTRSLVVTTTAAPDNGIRESDKDLLCSLLAADRAEIQSFAHSLDPAWIPNPVVQDAIRAIESNQAINPDTVGAEVCRLISESSMREPEHHEKALRKLEQEWKDGQLAELKANFTQLTLDNLDGFVGEAKKLL